MQYNSFGINAWQQFWGERMNLAGLEFLDCKHSPREGCSHVLHAARLSRDSAPTGPGCWEPATREVARKNIPSLYFFWIQLVLKPLETKTTSVVLVAVCEQGSPQYFSWNRERRILSLPAVQEVKPSAQLVLLDSRQPSWFSKAFALKKIIIIMNVHWEFSLKMYRGLWQRKGSLYPQWAPHSGSNVWFY